MGLNNYKSVIIFVLRLYLDQREAYKNSQQTERKARNAIEGKCDILRILEQLYIFDSEGGESSITTAETGGKEDAPVIGEPVEPGREAKYYTNDQTADHIDRKSTVREMRGV